MVDDLIKQIGAYFNKIKDVRRKNITYELADCLKAAFSMFSLKDSSLLLFRQRYAERSSNLERIFGIEKVPGDTALRTAIDQVDSSSFHGLPKELLEVVREEEVWESRQVLGGYMAVSIDGTGYYCSGKKSCEHCMVKTLKNGEEKYYHQMLGGVQMHPEVKTVFPLGMEPIIRQDGATKNDCEQNSAKRLLPRISEQFSEDSLLYVMDALYATGPMVKLIKEELEASFIIAIKEGYVKIQVDALRAKDKLETYSWSNGKTKGTARFANGLILNGTHQDILVNYVEYEEIDIQTGERKFYSSWITDIDITKDNVRELVQVARARWKIENETFNTLKNQNYQLEHNYGHGQKYLSTNFAILMFIAFLVDQIVQALSYNFQQAWKVCQSKKNLWEKIRQVFDLLPAKTMDAIYRFVANKRQINLPLLE